MSKNSLKEMKTEKKTEEYKEVIDQTESNKKSDKNIQNFFIFLYTSVPIKFEFIV